MGFCGDEIILAHHNGGGIRYGAQYDAGAALKHILPVTH